MAGKHSPLAANVKLLDTDQPFVFRSDACSRCMRGTKGGHLPRVGAVFHPGRAKGPKLAVSAAVARRGRLPASAGRLERYRRKCMHAGNARQSPDRHAPLPGRSALERVAVTVSPELDPHKLEQLLAR